MAHPMRILLVAYLHLFWAKPCPRSDTLMEEGTEELLGDPRLKNGLAYYPAVMTPQGIVCLGNIVRLSLQTEDGHSYVAYGHLKGLWLWRDQPYIRVQHFAPVHTNLPRTALAYRAEPELGKHAEELLVTTSVADHTLSSLLGPVGIEGGPLAGQLFQRNVNASCQRFHCTRHLDLSAQRAAALDESMQLTPLVQHFTEAALLSAAGVEGEAGRYSGTPTKALDPARKARMDHPSMAELKLPQKPLRPGELHELCADRPPNLSTQAAPEHLTLARTADPGPNTEP